MKTWYKHFYSPMTVLLADEEDVKYMLKNLIGEYDKWCIKINMAKTKDMMSDGKVKTWLYNKD